MTKSTFDNFIQESRDASSGLSREMEEILYESYVNTQFFAKFFFPNRFRRNWSSVHKSIFEFLDNCTARRRLILAPRGFGKSSIMNLAWTAKQILFQSRHYIVPVSKTADLAMAQSNNLRDEISGNEIIKQLFGSLPHKDDFSKERWQTNTGILVHPRGAKQQVRGLISGDFRPDQIIVDDLENDKEVLSAERRMELSEWFHGALLNIIDPYSQDYQIDVIGTILHEDSLLANLEKDSSFETVRFELCDDEYHSNWPEYISDEDCKKAADEARANGTIGVWFREFRNIAVPDELQDFRIEYFRYFSPDELKNSYSLQSFVIVDPAKTSDITSDDTGIIGVSVDAYLHKIYIRDIIAEKLKPDEIYAKTVEMAERIGAKNIGIEVTSLHEFIKQPFENYLSQRGYVYMLHDLTAKGKKEDRIASMIPYYRQGCVYHNSSNCTKLESQLLAFPRAKHDDVSDCLGYIPKMMDTLRIFFAHPIDQSAGDANKALVEAEFESLQEVLLDDDFADFPGPLQRTYY